VEQLDPFLVWLLEKVGVDAHDYRVAALQPRLPACLRALKTSSTQTAKALLTSQPSLLGRALDAVLIGVSGFFRDTEVFEGLSRHALPQLLQGRSGLRVCSLGCSTGQELYSVAMLLDKAGALAGSHLLGLDCRPEAIAHAQAGWFPVAALKTLASEFQERYFEREPTRSRICARLRETVRWQAGDLLQALAGEPPWDLLLFRNVAIYLEPECTEVWTALGQQLRLGGILVTGKGERPPKGWGAQRLRPCLYYKTESPT